MANTGNTYTITLKEAHLKWGIHRYTFTRDRIYGEGYLLIPIEYARLYNIYNSNATSGATAISFGPWRPDRRRFPCTCWPRC